MSKSTPAIETAGASDSTGQLMQALPSISETSKDLPVLHPNDINIVLFGETGVGKSTFINAFVNYLKFGSLEEATVSPNISCLIATKFTISDDNFEQHVVKFGDDENECHAAGASSPQSTRSYGFLMGEGHVRLIDTPAIGDTRGIIKDEENFERVLDALAQLKFVHAFCILLKPNNAKMTVLFQDCIKQLLSRLDKTASRNIVFVFTNSRSTFYKPGDSLVSVKELLESIKASSNVDIPFCKDNVFCMDNEAFRFLLASRVGVRFGEAEKRDFAASWEKSIDVLVKMLSYITHLAPHKIQDTISINEARRFIVNLSEPLARVAKNIDDNLRKIARQKEQMNDKTKTIEELKHPRTVCTHSDCTEIHVIDADIKREEEVRSKIVAMIKDLDEKRLTLENEKNTVQQAMARFAHFLSHNAITPYNDLYQEYIRYLIENENSKGAEDKNLIKSYKDLIKVHEQQTAILDEQLQQARKGGGVAKVITAEDVMNLVRDLYKLKECGNMIRYFYEKQQHTRQRENLLHTEAKWGAPNYATIPAISLSEKKTAISETSKDLPVLDPNDINIVLFGETGVGKSTFINAFVNYLNFGSLEEATTSPNIHCLIASKFTISDDRFEEYVVKFGDDENECHAAGASSTQSTRSYRFLMEERHVRLIDTPGIGDTRGIVKDEENFERVLDALAQLKFIHAFCILLKPNNAKLTVLFQYCIKQLLSRLDKTASKNIVFVFTNSRSTFYKPGDSLVPVKEILKSIKTTSNVDIPFCIANVFCMDNEAFRFLLASRDGVAFGEPEKRDFAASWNKSVDVSLKMLFYIAQLAPHKIQDTISINEARRLIVNLSEPLAMVAKNIDDNLRKIDRQQEQMNDKTKTIEELKHLLHFDMIKIEVIEIPHPKTVCTHTNCVEVHKVEDSKHINYKQVCHAHCLLKNVPKQVIGSPELRNCLAMNADWPNPHCDYCNHSFSIHMHVYFDTKPYVSRELDKKVNANIEREEVVRSNIAAVISYLDEQRFALEKEKDIVQKGMARFAHFLRHNAITPYNDTYQEYIRYLIDHENSLGSDRDRNLIKSYNDMIKVHEQQTAILDKQLKQAEKSVSGAKFITAEDVMKLVQDLYDLKFSGKVIRDFYEKQQHTRQRENLLHTEKNVDTRGSLGSFIKKAYNKIAPKSIQLK